VSQDRFWVEFGPHLTPEQHERLEFAPQDEMDAVMSRIAYECMYGDSDEDDAS
jgi:hypothetical protein